MPSIVAVTSGLVSGAFSSSERVSCNTLSHFVLLLLARLMNARLPRAGRSASCFVGDDCLKIVSISFFEKLYSSFTASSWSALEQGL